MTISDLSTLSKVAIGLALAGFFFSFTTTYSHSVNGVGVCVFRDNAKLALGGLAIVFGAIGAIRRPKHAQCRSGRCPKLPEADQPDGIGRCGAAWGASHPVGPRHYRRQLLTL